MKTTVKILLDLDTDLQENQIKELIKETILINKVISETLNVQCSFVDVYPT